MNNTTVVPQVAVGNKWSANIHKKVVITEFPSGVEVFFETCKAVATEAEFYDAEPKAARGEGDLERNRERSARRAKTNVRRQCKMIDADQMLTLTYRENMRDMDRLQRDVKAFVKRVRALGPFEYVLCVEEQQRGALHVHMACQRFPAWMANAEGVKVKSYNLLRSIWRRVVGADNGNVDLTKPRRNASHRIACYISKYIAKGIEGAVFNAKRYWASRGIPKPRKTVLWFSKHDSDWDIISLVLGDAFDKGYSDVAQYADKFNGFYWFAASSPS